MFLFTVTRGGKPVEKVSVVLLRCRSAEACWPAYDPASYPDSCVPTTTNKAGAMVFYIWPPLQSDGELIFCFITIEGTASSVISFRAREPTRREVLDAITTYSTSLTVKSMTCFAAYGFRAKASVDGISYYSKRIPPDMLHPNRTWQESLSIPIGIMTSTSLDISLEGINLQGTHQRIWPIIQLRIVQVATGQVSSPDLYCTRQHPNKWLLHHASRLHLASRERGLIKAFAAVLPKCPFDALQVIDSTLESLNNLSDEAYSTLTRSSSKVWPLRWEEPGLDLDIRSDYVVQAIAYGSQGGWILEQSRQVLSADAQSHSLSYQVRQTRRDPFRSIITHRS